MPRLRYWQHIRSGEVYVIQVREGVMVRVAGPLGLHAAARDGWESLRADEERIAWLTAHRAEFRTVPAWQLGIIERRSAAS